MKFVQDYLQKNKSSISVQIASETREIYAKYQILHTLDPTEPTLFSVLQAHRHYSGLILVSQASNPLNVSLLQHDYEAACSNVKGRDQLISKRWIVFCRFESNLNTVSDAIILSDKYDDMSQHHELLASVAQGMLSEVANELEEKRQLPDTTFEDYLNSCDIELVDNSGQSAVANSKRRLQGRHRKFIGDLCLLTGKSKEALLNYHSAVDSLRAVGDYLWLGIALEGICVTSGIQMTNPSEDSENYTTAETIFDKLLETLKLIGKYKQAAQLEIEICCVAARMLYSLKKPLEAANFIHQAVYVSLPVKRPDEKIARFHAISNLFKELKMNRKASFFKRIAALQSVTIKDSYWPSCLSSFEKSLVGFGVDGEGKKWADVQFRVLYETSYACQRCRKYKKALQYLLKCLDNSHENLPVGKQRELVKAIQQLRISIDKKEDKDKSSQTILEFNKPDLAKFWLYPQPNYLKLSIRMAQNIPKIIFNYS